jgi:hypothetical protein
LIECHAALIARTAWFTYSVRPVYHVALAQLVEFVTLAISESTRITLLFGAVSDGKPWYWRSHPASGLSLADIGTGTRLLGGFDTLSR